MPARNNSDARIGGVVGGVFQRPLGAGQGGEQKRRSAKHFLRIEHGFVLVKITHCGAPHRVHGDTYSPLEGTEHRVTMDAPPHRYHPSKRLESLVWCALAAI